MQISDPMFKERSVADVSEGELVERLLTDPVWRSRIINVKGIPRDALAFTNVLLAGLPGDYKGDIDVLLCSPNKPSATVAIQVKRIKVGIRALRECQPNKLPELEKGIRQTNLLASIGFSQVYLYVLVAVDGREKTPAEPNSWGGPSQELRQLLYDKISVGVVRHLHERVGLFRCQFVQPVDDRPLGTGSYTGELVRLAKIARQPLEVSRWVAERIETLAPVSPSLELRRKSRT